VHKIEKKNMDEKMRISLTVGWLSENELMEPALAVLGYQMLDPRKHTGPGGMGALDPDGKKCFLEWEDCLNFTIEQLLCSGVFEAGDPQKLLTYAVTHALCTRPGLTAPQVLQLILNQFGWSATVHFKTGEVVFGGGK
jgi:hypothetical protein